MRLLLVLFGLVTLAGCSGDASLKAAPVLPIEANGDSGLPAQTTP